MISSIIRETLPPLTCSAYAAGTPASRDGKRCKRDDEGKQDGAGVEVEDLLHPLQGHAGLNPAKVIHRDTGGNGQACRDHQKCGHKDGKDQLSGKDQAIAHGITRRRPPCCR
jgi:hypothetical protein